MAQAEPVGSPPMEITVLLGMVKDLLHQVETLEAAQTGQPGLYNGARERQQRDAIYRRILEAINEYEARRTQIVRKTWSTS